MNGIQYQGFNANVPALYDKSALYGLGNGGGPFSNFDATTWLMMAGVGVAGFLLGRHFGGR